MLHIHRPDVNGKNLPSSRVEKYGNGIINSNSGVARVLLRPVSKIAVERRCVTSPLLPIPIGQVGPGSAPRHSLRRADVA